MSAPLGAANHPKNGPYRESPGGSATRTRVHYRPGASLWALLVVVLLTLPLAYAARRQLPGAQRTITCTTFDAPPVERCTAWDRSTGDVRRVPCRVAEQALEGELAGLGLFRGPALTVVSTVTPVESRPIPATGNFISGHRTAMFSNVPRSSTTDAATAARWNAIERPADGTISPEGARALLGVCASAPPAETEHRTVALMIVPRDDRAPALVLLAGLLLLVLLAARGSVVTIDPTAAELGVADKLGPLALRPVKVRLADVLDVIVTTSASGPFLGQRVELVLVDGSRIPLASSHSPFATRAHERTAIALKRGLGLLAT